MPFETKREDRPFVVLATTVFFLSLLVTALDFLLVQKLVYHFEFLDLAGFVLFVVGVLLRFVGKRALGKYYSYGLRVQPNQKLVKVGVYRYVRHPISLAAVLYGVAIPLILSSLYGFVIMLGLVPLILYRIRIEERMLIEKFGDEYREYMKKTKKLIPSIF